jgi:branched-chain amino acid transport system substrate-binding protein
LAAAPIYQKAGLVMISPTSFANQLSGFGNYVFRTIPPTNVLADILADHVVKTRGKIKMVACFDELSPDNVAYKDAFLSAFQKQGGQVSPIVCNFSAPDFDAAKIMMQMTGVQGILLTPHVDRLSKVFDLAQENQGKIPLYSSPTLYTAKTIQVGKENVLGLVMPAVWHPKQNSDQKFAKQANTLWGGTVNWRTATAYDATMAIAQGLTQDSTRAGLQKALRSPSFTSQGAGGVIQFTASGDRQIMPILVQVKASSGGYAFAPFEAKAPELTKPTEPQEATVPQTQP